MAEQRLAKLVHSLQELVFGSRLSHNLVTTVSAGAYDAIHAAWAVWPETPSLERALPAAVLPDAPKGYGRRNVSTGKRPHEEVPRETPADDPRQETDWPNTKQTNQPWKGKVEKDQQNKGKDIDLEKWQESNTH
jgi:hypothetical protein